MAIIAFSFSVRLNFIIGEPWNDNWADRTTIDFTENAHEVQAAVQNLFENGSDNEINLKDIKIVARVVNFQ